MRNKIRISVVVSAVVLVNALLIYKVSGLNSNAEKEINLPGLTLNSGDLVFRNGNGLISRLFRNSSLQEKKFGHTGIIVFKNDMPYVAHVQQDRPGPALIVEPLSTFWKEEICDQGAIYRLKLNDDEKSKLLDVMTKNLERKIVFDAHFNMEDHTSVYCSEWIRDMIVESTGDSNYFPLSQAGDFRYVAPDNLYLNEHAVLIFNYTKE